MFFHVTAVTAGLGIPEEGDPRPELQEMVRPGQHVEYSPQESEGRVLAADVRTYRSDLNSDYPPDSSGQLYLCSPWNMPRNSAGNFMNCMLELEPKFEFHEFHETREE